MSSDVGDLLAEMTGRLRSLESRMDFQERLEMVNPAIDGQAVGFALSLPGLSGLWTGAYDRNSATLLDISGNNLPLALSGTGTAIALDSSLPFAPYVILPSGGGGNSLNHGDAARIDVSGTEATIAAAINGLTVAAWVWFDNAASAIETVFAHWNNSTNQRAYVLRRTAAGYMTFGVSSNGTAETFVTHTTIAGQDGWLFTAGRYDPSAELAVWLNREKVTNTTSIPASIHASTAELKYGEGNGTLNGLAGRIGQPTWFAASALPDTAIEKFYELTAPLFGVTL